MHNTNNTNKTPPQNGSSRTVTLGTDWKACYLQGRNPQHKNEHEDTYPHELNKNKYNPPLMFNKMLLHLCNLQTYGSYCRSTDDRLSKCSNSFVQDCSTSSSSRANMPHLRTKCLSQNTSTYCECEPKLTVIITENNKSSLLLTLVRHYSTRPNLLCNMLGLTNVSFLINGDAVTQKTNEPQSVDDEDCEITLRSNFTSKGKRLRSNIKESRENHSLTLLSLLTLFYTLILALACPLILQLADSVTSDS